MSKTAVALSSITLAVHDASKASLATKPLQSGALGLKMIGDRQQVAAWFEKMKEEEAQLKLRKEKEEEEARALKKSEKLPRPESEMLAMQMQKQNGGLKIVGHPALQEIMQFLPAQFACMIPTLCKA